MNEFQRPIRSILKKPEKGSFNAKKLVLQEIMKGGVEEVIIIWHSGNIDEIEIRFESSPTLE